MDTRFRIACLWAFPFFALASQAATADGSTRWTLPRFSEDAVAVYKAASAVTTLAGTDVVVLDEEESYVFDAEGRAVHTRYLLYKILTQQGAEDWDRVSINWEPWHEERPTLRARIITPDNAVHPLESKTVTDAPAQDEADNVYSDRRVVRAPFPAIAPGSLVEEEEITKESAVFFGAGMVTRFYFGRAVPVQYIRLVIDAPSSLPIQFKLELLPDLKPERKEENGRVQLLFERGPVEALEEGDANLPSDVPVFPHVAFSTGKSWKLMAESYEKIVDGKIAAANVQPMVKSVIAGKSSREEKAAAIVQYLDHEVRYTGVEFGEAAIVPRPPTETLKQKYGDCKDKATLLVAMLREAGIPSYVALLNAGSREDVPVDLPGMGLFDHAIVYAPGKPDFWVDATDQYARLGQLSAADQGRLALVARAESEALVSTPVLSSQENLLLEKREFTLAENGPAHVVETSEPRGGLESEYRSYYADEENKNRKKGLTDYMKSQYLADKLDKMDRSDPRDLSKPFQLVLETNKAKRGITELDTAVVAIRLESIFQRLPEELQKKEEDKNADAAKDKPKKPRTMDYQLNEAFATEWQYTVHPPVGFQSKPLPANQKIQLGPTLLTEEFSAEKDGVVHATIRFDTVKRRFTVAEAKEMQEKISQVREERPLLLSFEPVAVSLFQQGKTRESFQAYHYLIALHPKESVHHLQLARALLTGGLGQAAREEAQLGVKLEPKSALAQKTLAEILEYDLVGRQLRHGSDYAGAEAALRAAIKLDPEDKETPGNLAILLEHNSDGERYAPGAKLKEAVAAYKTLTPEELAESGLKDNLAYALIYAGEFAEARRYSEGLNPQPLGIIVAAEAASNGSQAGIAEARKRAEGEAQQKQTMATAGEILMRLRKYPVAADLMEAGAAGQNASRNMGLAALLRKARPHEGLQYKDDALGIVMEFFRTLTDAKLTKEKMYSIFSRNAITVMNNSDPEELEQNLRAGQQMRHGLSRTGYPADVMLDVVFQAIEPKVEGDDASGYRVTLQVPGSKNLIMYVVKEDGKYKNLDSSEKSNAIGLEIMDRLAAGNTAGARVLLDWVREAEHLAGGDDPLEGFAFPRMWTKGKDADAARMKLAAAAILAQTKETAEKGIPILETALGTEKNETDKLNLQLALLNGYSSLEDYGRLHGIASVLLKQYPESKRIFFYEQFALLGLGKFQEADALAEDRLKRMPDDIDAMRALVHSATAREDYALAHERDRSIAEAGKEEASDLNGLAWLSLFTGKVTDADVDSAVKAARTSQNSNAAILHTLGCIYAETGKTKEAREVLIQGMDLLSLDEPNPIYWYAFGRIAEQYGEREIAKADYARVTKPREAMQIPESSYRLAQNRLKALQGTAANESPAKK